MRKEHQKHAKLARPSIGEWGRTELALLGAPCTVIRAFADRMIRQFAGTRKLGFVDADHHEEAERPLNGAAIRFTDKITHHRIELSAAPSRSMKHALFADMDLVLVNGNHFSAKQQVVFIDPSKPLAGKTSQLNDVRLILIQDETVEIPDYLQDAIAGAPVLFLSQGDEIFSFMENFLQQQIPPLNGLVLAGGSSQRMGQDKGLLLYHGVNQREHVYGVLQPYCSEVFLSCNASQSRDMALPYIEDRFLGIGPMGGILSAMQSAPNAAWLIVACDLPYLSTSTLEYLIANRNPSALATAFRGAEGLPEPLVAIWEPHAYPVLLQALGEGMSCPRKILIDAGISLLDAPHLAELQNVNDPHAYSQATISLKANGANVSK